MTRRALALAGALAILLTACGEKPAMTAQDARIFTSRALARIGLPGAVVAPSPTLARYRSPDPRYRNDAPIDVWQTRATLPDGQVELYVQRRGDSAVFVRDTRNDGTRLLSDAQFAALGRFRLNPADQRRRDDQRPIRTLGIAVLVVAVVSLFATVLTGAADNRQRVHSTRHR